MRFFVVDINEPVIRLYLKNGFKRVNGIYEEKFDDVLFCMNLDMKLNFKKHYKPELFTAVP